MLQRRFPAAAAPRHRAARPLLPSLYQVAVWAALAALAAVGSATQAQPCPQAEHRVRPSLGAAFEAAWARQPEAQALALLREAAAARQQAAQAWTPEPPAVEASVKTDRLHRNQGSREVEAGVSLPLWLPGERGRSQSLADAESRAVESRAQAARLRLAGSLREAWWAWQRAGEELQAARAQQEGARRIAADVARRLRAGDLARADQHQAEAALALADAAVALAEGEQGAAAHQLMAWTDWPLSALQGVSPGEGATAEPLPAPAVPGALQAPAPADGHPDLRDLLDRAAVAEGSAALAATRTRAHPELTLALTRERGAAGEAEQPSITLGLRMAFGAGARQDAQLAQARAEALELQTQAALERARLKAASEAARSRWQAAQARLDAQERRARLATESRSFFEKSFHLGETDLPTRLRIETEAAEAERQLGLARIELSAAVSAWRQALGLLPQ